MNPPLHIKTLQSISQRQTATFTRSIPTKHANSNGGAGALGLIRALATDYLSTLPDAQSHQSAITWTCNHSRNTQLALLQGHIDLALTYERDQEDISVEEGWAESAGCIFHDHFVLAGPMRDPAGVEGAGDVWEGFRRIREATKQEGKESVKFTARCDSSATMIKERSIWDEIGLEPWTDETGKSSWYIRTLFSPAEAVRAASQGQTYLLTDRSTFLQQTSLGNVKDMTVFFEPQDGEDVLMNSCYALFDPRASPEVKGRLDAFLRYVRSERGQGVIGEFGRVECGMAFFAEVGEGYAREGIVGGKAEGGQWVRREQEA